MKVWLSIVGAVYGALCVLLAVAVIATGKTTQRLQTELQRQQGEINNGLLSQRGQQLGNSILQDMVSVSARNTHMHKLLGDNGYNIQFKQPAATAPAKNKEVTP